MGDAAMKKLFWPLAIHSWGDAERKAAHAVIDGDRHVMGDRVQEFEWQFAKYVGAKYAVMTNSGSSANLVMATVLKLSSATLWENDRKYEVIVPAIAWSTTYSPFALLGCRLRVVDVNPYTLNADAIAVRAAITRDTVGIVGVSVLGNPAELGTMNMVAKEVGLFFVEDNCESLGAQIGSRLCGTIGRMGTFSTFFSHQLNTIEGGMLVTDDWELYKLALMVRAHGWDRDLPSTESRAGAAPYGYSYSFVVPGFNVRPTELAAAVGLEQLKKLSQMNEQRRKNHRYFNELFLGEDQWWRIQTCSAGAVPFGFVIVMPSLDAKNKVLRKLDAAGIEHRMVTGGSFSQHSAHRYYDWQTHMGTPNADHIHHCGFFVGNHPVDLSEQIAHLHHLITYHLMTSERRE